MGRMQVGAHRNLRSFFEAVLNHVSGHKGRAAGIYNRSTYAAEKRAAFDLWAGHVMGRWHRQNGGRSKGRA